MRIALIFIIWTWGLTPLWVNIVATILLIISFIVKGICKIIDWSNTDDYGDYYGY